MGDTLLSPTFSIYHMRRGAVTVIIPTYNYSNFILRALASIDTQTFKDFQIIIIDDGSSENLEIFATIRSKYPAITLIRNPTNMGLGYCLNQGLDAAETEYICYLPADDLFFSEHLETLKTKLDENPNTILAYSGLRYHYTDSSYSSHARTTFNTVDGYLQLVQVMHRKTSLRWLEREELVTDNLEEMFWKKLRPHGSFTSSHRISCEWISHPLQRHKIINELFGGGGIHRYKEHYGVKQKLKFQSSRGNFIDEGEDFIAVPRVERNCPGGLKILLVGELAYNADRIVSLEERGHQLYGLWMKEPYFYNTIGPLPFGHVIDIAYENWIETVKNIQPDIIYGLLNHPAVAIVHEVLQSGLNIPFVWHFKESPFYCRQSGTWNELINLFQQSDGQIYINEECQRWFAEFLNCKSGNPHILDGDLPAKSYFKEDRSALLSERDGEIHTLIAGRPLGLSPEDVRELVSRKIHLHFYGDYNHGAYRNWLTETQCTDSGYIHLHKNCHPKDWTKEFSQYDAGWLHIFESQNFSESARTEWHDLNFPARISTLACAGLPMIQKNNSMHTVASERLCRSLDIGIYFSSFDELKYHLSDKEAMSRLRENCWNERHFFSFDQHADQLIGFFKKTIALKQSSNTVLV